MQARVISFDLIYRFDLIVQEEDYFIIVKLNIVPYSCNKGWLMVKQVPI